MKIKRILSCAIAALMLASTSAVAVSAVEAHHIDYTRTGSLHFIKYEVEDPDGYAAMTTHGNGELATVPDGASPIEGVRFSAWKIDDVNNFFDPDTQDVAKQLPKVGTGELVTETGTDTYSYKNATYTPANADFTGISNAQGQINFTSMPLGIYLVAETWSPSQISQKTAPFVVSVPSTRTNKTEWMYDITVQPKNQVAYATINLDKYDRDDNTKKLADGYTFVLEEEIWSINGNTSNVTKTWTPVAQNGSQGSTASKEANGTWTTNAQGGLTIEHLATNRNYRIRETQATNSEYIVESDVYYYFHINGDKSVTYINADGSTPYVGTYDHAATVQNDRSTAAKFMGAAPAANNTLQVTNEDITLAKFVSTDTSNDALAKAWGKHTTQDTNKTVYFKVAAEIPDAIKRMGTYKIVDTMTKGFTFTGNATMSDIEVYAGATKLTYIDDYTVRVGTSVDNAATGGSSTANNATVFIIETTQAGRNKMADAAQSDFSVVIKTTLNTDALIAADNTNEADLVYTNNILNASTDSDTSDRPEAHTGGYTLFKSNETGTEGMENIEFEVYRTEADAKAKTNPIKWSYDSTKGCYFVDDSNASASSIVKTNANGYVVLKGLLYGDQNGANDGTASNAGTTTYWMSETKTAEGYHLLDDAFSFVVTPTSEAYTDGTSRHIINYPVGQYPITGAQAALTFSIIGGVVVAAGLFVMFFKKRNKNDK